MTASAELRDVTDQSFASEVLASETPALVDFWGDHCPACRQISPILKQLAADYVGLPPDPLVARAGHRCAR